MREDRLIYIAPHFSSFVREDIFFLSEAYTVIAPEHNWRNKLLFPWSMFKQFFFLITHLGRSKAVFVMFGGYWSLLPALLGKLFRTAVYIIPGGTDCVSFPSLGYGSLRKPLLRSAIKMSFSCCSRLLPVDESLVFCRYSYLDSRDFDFQGYRYFFPGLKTERTVIHNGFDPEQFQPGGSSREFNSFITIAAVDDANRFRIKGIDTVITLALTFPQCTFRVVGLSAKLTASLEVTPSNVILLPFVKADELARMYNASEFILQLSVSEGFPNALCEGMLCGCIPVVSSVGAMPMIIGDTGFLVESSGTDYLTRRFGEIITTSEEVRERMSFKARERVGDEYHIEKRKMAFFKLLDDKSGQ